MPVVVWAAGISLLSTGSFSGEETSRFLLPLLRWLWPDASPGGIAVVHAAVRKLAHVAEYAVLGCLLHRALAAGAGFTAGNAVRAVILAGLFSLLDEWHQSFVPSRGASLGDCLIDTTGAVLGQGLWAAVARLPFRSRRDPSARGPATRAARARADS